jgi:hypothetical protein
VGWRSGSPAVAGEFEGAESLPDELLGAAEVAGELACGAIDLDGVVVAEEGLDQLVAAAVAGGGADLRQPAGPVEDGGEDLEGGAAEAAGELGDDVGDGDPVGV